VPHGLGASKRSVDRSRGPCTIAVGAHSAGTRDGTVMGVGDLVSETGVRVRGVVGTSIAGVCAWGVPLRLGRVTMWLRVM
jgi:hypothetical protein